jgi:hypothetical protein
MVVSSINNTTISCVEFRPESALILPYFFSRIIPMQTNNRKVKMQTNKSTLAEEMFNQANMINNVSRTGNLYGKLFAIKDMQIYLLKQEKLLNEEIEKLEKGQNE